MRARQRLEAWLQGVWYNRPGPPPLALGILSPIYRRLTASRAGRPPRSEGPVIVVGNLVAGGSGKTPVVAELARRIAATGRRVAIISRGYGGRSGDRPLRVDDQTPFARAGDEPIELYRATGLSVWVCRQRAHALAAATQEGAEVVLSDDGLQHQALPRSFEICLVDAARGFGNGRLLPAGPLRQPVSRLESVDLVLRKCSGQARAPALPDGIDFQLESGPLQGLMPDADPPPAPSATVDALAGIADPQPFFDTLTRRGFELRTHRLADHQPIPARLLQTLSGPVVMTAKDAARLDAEAIAARPDLFVLPVRAALPEPVVNRVLAHVREFHP